MTKLRRRWIDLAARLHIPVPMAENVFNHIETLYSIPRRAYHNLDHIARCLRDLESLSDACESPDAVETAIWFHDAVYVPGNEENEKQSADLAGEMLRVLGQPEDFINKVAELILATRHDHPPRNPDEAVIIDVDLAGLGAPASRFNRDGRAIREEYDWVPEEEYCAARAAILQRFLDRPAIYHTTLFHERYEERARQNLRRALKRFASPPM